MAGAGGITRLRRMIPSAIAEHMILTGEPITAARAYEVGLVSEIVPPADLMTKVSQIANRIAAMPPQAILACRDLAQDDHLPVDAALTKERATFRRLMQSQELRDNLARFSEEGTRMFGQSEGESV